MIKILGLCLALTVISGCSSFSLFSRGPAEDLRTSFLALDYGGKTLNLRIGISNPAGNPVGDVLYVHGFADRLDNHGPLFKEWTNAGLRVISFDLPSHGLDSGDYNNLNNFDFESLAELVAKVEEATKPSEKRPLILAGWSTGGLIVVRMLQKEWTDTLSRPVAGVILFAPGVSVRKFPWTFGDRLGDVTEATLTHDPHPPHVGAINPSTPFWSPLIFKFAPLLILNSALSQAEQFPLTIPTLVFSGGNAEDMYAKAWVVRSWVEDQSATRLANGKSAMISIQCPHAMHELDNELQPYGGLEVRRSAAAFAQNVAKGINDLPETTDILGTICHRLE